MDVGQHSRFISIESVYDVLRREWANSFKQRIVTTKDVQASAHSGNQRIQESALEMGWALNQPKTIDR